MHTCTCTRAPRAAPLPRSLAVRGRRDRRGRRQAVGAQCRAAHVAPRIPAPPPLASPPTLRLCPPGRRSQRRALRVQHTSSRGWPSSAGGAGRLPPPIWRPMPPAPPPAPHSLPAAPPPPVAPPPPPWRPVWPLAWPPPSAAARGHPLRASRGRGRRRVGRWRRRPCAPPPPACPGTPPRHCVAAGTAHTDRSHRGSTTSERQMKGSPCHTDRRRRGVRRRPLNPTRTSSA